MFPNKRDRPIFASNERKHDTPKYKRQLSYTENHFHRASFLNDDPRNATRRDFSPSRSRSRSSYTGGGTEGDDDADDEFGNGRPSTLSDYERTLAWTKGYANPHTAQYFCGPERSQAVKEQFSRILAPDAAGLSYHRRRDERKSVVHWGQRKLLMSEIEFLTLYAVPDCTVVYAGAAPGTHTGFLADMFPEVKKFVLVDPGQFSVRPGPRIQVIQDLFTDDMAFSFRGQDVLFISDIRTANWHKLNRDDVEEAVQEDMMAQMRWHLLMQPRHSMLKFRLPWEDGKTAYLNGTVFLPVWGPQTTTETRLVVARDAKMKDWDNRLYESQMFRFNTVTRVQNYPHQVRAEGIDHCFDCASEVEILRRYLETRHRGWLDGKGLHPVELIAGKCEIRERAEETPELSAAAVSSSSSSDPSSSSVCLDSSFSSSSSHISLDAPPSSLDSSCTSLADATSLTLCSFSALSAASSSDTTSSSSSCTFVDATSLTPCWISAESVASSLDTTSSSSCRVSLERISPSANSWLKPDGTSASSSFSSSLLLVPRRSSTNAPRTVASVAAGADRVRVTSGGRKVVKSQFRGDATYHPEAESQPFPTPCSGDMSPIKLKRLLNCISEMSARISKACSSGARTLTTLLPPPEKRRRFNGVF